MAKTRTVWCVTFMPYKAKRPKRTILGCVSSKAKAEQSLRETKKWIGDPVLLKGFKFRLEKKKI